MHLGSIYLVTNNFENSIRFYEALLEMPVTHKNMERFAMFSFEGHCISIMNAHFDKDNPNQVVHKGEYDAYFDDLESVAYAKNTHKFVLNFWVEDLQEEFQRIKKLGISSKMSDIKYVCNVEPYYYFQLIDPDENIIEVTGMYDGKVE